MPQLLLFPGCPPSRGQPRSFDESEQAAVLDLLLRGASPQAACQRLELDVASYFATIEQDESFRDRLRQTLLLMTHNVVSVVYAAAVKGTPAAQALWLRTFPPAEWAPPELPPTTESDDAFTMLTDEALEQEVLALRGAIAAATRSETGASPSTTRPRVAAGGGMDSSAGKR